MILSGEKSESEEVRYGVMPLTSSYFFLTKLFPRVSQTLFSSKEDAPSSEANSW